MEEAKKQLLDLRKKLDVNYYQVTYCLGHSTYILMPDNTVFKTPVYEDGNEEDDEYYGKLDNDSICFQTDIIQIASGYSHVICLKKDGTVVAYGNNKHGQCNVLKWRNVIQVAACRGMSLGLMSNGTVVVIGEYTEIYDTSSWNDIVKIKAMNSIQGISGYKKDGSIVEKGISKIFGEFNISSWKGIKDVASNVFFTVGLKDDGTVVATGSNKYGQCNVSDWCDVVEIANWNVYFTLGLKSDGTVVAVGDIEDIYSDLSKWENIIQIAIDYQHNIFGLKANGTVLYIKGYDEDYYEPNKVLEWEDIVKIYAFNRLIVDLKSDNSFVVVGVDWYGKRNVTNEYVYIWEKAKRHRQEELKLIKEENERIMQAKQIAEENERIKQAEHWQSMGLCRHCGGSLKGIFKKTCLSCGRDQR